MFFIYLNSSSSEHVGNLNQNQDIFLVQSVFFTGKLVFDQDQDQDQDQDRDFKKNALYEIIEVIKSYQYGLLNHNIVPK